MVRQLQPNVTLVLLVILLATTPLKQQGRDAAKAAGVERVGVITPGMRIRG